MANIFKKAGIALSLIPFITFAENTPTEDEWKTPAPVYKQEFDWLKLTSGEWLKGDIISMYDEVLEFDSDKLDAQSIDWEDVSELRSKEKQSIRLVSNRIKEGYVVVTDGKLSIVNGNESESFAVTDIISIASSSENEWDLWTGYANVGLNVSRGNTEQFDYTVTAGVQRRSSSSRFKTDFIANYSKTNVDDVNNVGTTIEQVTADSQRLTSQFDWFFSQKIFFRVADAEYYSDEITNISSRISYGVGLGYQLIDSSKMNWEVTAGPSYQTTKFVALASGDLRENSAVLALGTSFDYEITSDIDYDLSYQVQFVNEKSGDILHTFQTGLEVDLAGDFDLDVTFYLDRTKEPTGDIEENDYRLVVSLGYDF